MKVVFDEGLGPDAVRFSDIKQGETFQDPRGWTLYMRTQGGCGLPNAVSLQSGSTQKFEDHKHVVRIAARVFVEDPKARIVGPCREEM